MQATASRHDVLVERTPSQINAWLHCVVFAPEDRRQMLDTLMSEQGQCWVGGYSRSGNQSPLIKYEFLGAGDRINAMDRAVTAILEALQVKFYTFVVPQ